MRALAKEIAAVGAFIAIGTVVSLAVALPHQADASPDPGVSYVWRGLSPAPSGLFCYPWHDPDLPGYHPCWHDENSHQYTAIDYSYYWPDDCTGEDVWLDYTGDFQLFKMAEQTDYCTGVRAKIYLGSYAEQNYKGDLHYLHIDPNELWIGQEVPYQLIYIGDVLAQELDPGCPWDGAHLHQSARITAETPFYTNGYEDPSQAENWEHAIVWEPDSDDDGDSLGLGAPRYLRNKTEVFMGTDPEDDCADTATPNNERGGAYSEPLSPWPPDFTDNGQIDIGDLVLLKNHWVPLGNPYGHRYDLNASGDCDMGDLVILKLYWPPPIGGGYNTCTVG